MKELKQQCEITRWHIKLRNDTSKRLCDTMCEIFSDSTKEITFYGIKTKESLKFHLSIIEFILNNLDNIEQEIPTSWDDDEFYVIIEKNNNVDGFCSQHKGKTNIMLAKDANFTSSDIAELKLIFQFAVDEITKIIADENV